MLGEPVLELVGALERGGLGSARDVAAGAGWARATHRVQALDVANMAGDGEGHGGGHAADREPRRASHGAEPDAGASLGEVGLPRRWCLGPCAAGRPPRP